MASWKGGKSSIEGLLPEDRRAWAVEIWADRFEVAKLPSGPWMLREAARTLGLGEEVVDELLESHVGR